MWWFGSFQNYERDANSSICVKIGEDSRSLDMKWHIYFCDAYLSQHTKAKRNYVANDVHFPIK